MSPIKLSSSLPHIYQHQHHKFNIKQKGHNYTYVYVAPRVIEPASGRKVQAIGPRLVAATMKAFVIESYTHPSKLSLSLNAPEPALAENQVLIDVYSAALNFFDILQSQGKYQNQPPFPFVLGAEFAGKISKGSPIPKGCPFKPGDPVFGYTQGTYAERCAADWRDLHPVPNNMTMDQASGLKITWPTSYEALVGRAKLQPGEWVLVTAGAGGVGLSAVQIAKALGAKVIATAGSEEKLKVCREQGGSDYALNYTKQGWQKEVMQLTGGHGVDVIYDPVGRIRGRALVVGFAGGEIEKLPLNLVLLKNVSVVGIHWGAYAKFDRSRVPEVWTALFNLFELGKVKPRVFPKVWALEDLTKGLATLERRETWGKAVVRVQADELARL